MLLWHREITRHLLSFRASGVSNQDQDQLFPKPELVTEWRYWRLYWGGCVPVLSSVSQSVEGTAGLLFHSGSWLILVSPKTWSKRWSCFPSGWVRPSEWFGLNLASWKSLGVLCWTSWENSSFPLRSQQLSDNCCHQHWAMSFFDFFFWASMCKRNTRGNFALHHPGGTVQDVSTSNFRPKATTES